MSLVLALLWLPHDAWSQKPKIVLSHSLFAMHNCTLGSGHHKLWNDIKEAELGWEDIESKQKCQREKGRSQEVPVRLMLVVVLTWGKLDKQGTHYKEEHVHACINISSMDLIFSMHPTHIGPSAFHLNCP